MSDLGNESIYLIKRKINMHIKFMSQLAVIDWKQIPPNLAVNSRGIIIRLQCESN